MQRLLAIPFTVCNFLHVKRPTPRVGSLLRAGQRLERKLNPPKPIIDENAGWVPSSLQADVGGQSVRAEEDGESWRPSRERRRSRSPDRR